MTRSILIALLLFSVFACNAPQPAHSLDDARAAYDAESFEQAAELLLPYAELGELEAQSLLGRIYITWGEKDPPFLPEGVRWIKRAARRGDAKAQFIMGYLFYAGLGVPERPGKAARWYRKAAAQGVAKAYTELGFMHMYGEGWGVKQDEVLARKLYLKGFGLGDPRAAYRIAGLYSMGWGELPKDRREAHRWDLIAAQLGDSWAQDSVADNFKYGRGVEKDAEKSVYWSGRAIETYLEYGEVIEARRSLHTLRKRFPDHETTRRMEAVVAAAGPPDRPKP